MKLRHAALIVAPALPLVGAKGCSNTDCDRAKAEVERVCAAGGDSQLCLAAKVGLETACKPAPKPEDPCQGKAPLCVAQSDVDCWAVNKAGACQFWSKPNPAPDPTPIPTPTPTPTPQPDGFLTPPPYIDDDAVTVIPGDMRATRWDELWAAVNDYKATLPGDWNPEQTCLAQKAAGIDRAFGQIAARLDRKGITAGQPIEGGGKRIDAIAVGRGLGADGTEALEYYHLFEYGGGCLATSPKSLVGVWSLRVKNVVVEDDFGCPAPRPERVWTKETLPLGWGENEIGQPRWKLTSEPRGAWIDTTAVTIRNLPYAEAIGMSPMDNGAPRDGVPMRNEGPRWVERCEEYIHGENPYGLTLAQCQAARTSKDRVACEKYVAGGTWIVDSDDGKPCEQNPDNPAQFAARDGHCRLCSPSKTVCTRLW